MVSPIPTSSAVTVILYPRSYSEGKLDTDIDIAGHFDHLRELDGLLGGSLEVLEREDLEAGVGDELLGLRHVGALQTGNDGDAQVHVRHGGDQTLGDGVAADDAAEDIDEDGSHLRVVGDQAEGLLDGLTGGSSSAVEEVGGLSAIQLDDVHGGHGKTGSVDETSDVTVELDEVESEPLPTVSTYGRDQGPNGRHTLRP